MGCNTTGYTGRGYCSNESQLGKPTGIILAEDGTEFSSADFLLQDSWVEMVKQGKIFPIHGATSGESNSKELEMKDYDNGQRIKVGDRIYRFTLNYNLNNCLLKQVDKFDGFKGGVFLVNENIIFGRTDDGGETIKPLRLNNVFIDTVLPTSTEPQNTMVMVDIKKKTDIIDFRVSEEMTWDVGEVDGLTPVTLIPQSGATATSLSVLVVAECGGNSKPISGLGGTSADWTIGTGTISSATESSTVRGQYTIAGTGMEGDIDLAAPSVRSDDVMVISEAAVPSGIA